MRPYVKPSTGFTLLEVMVAILLLSVLAIMTLQITQMAFRAQTQAQDQRLSRAEIRRTMALFERDVLQIITRNPAKRQGGFSLTDRSLRFITQDTVTAEVMPGRAQSVSVNWIFNNGTLWRQSGENADGASGTDVMVPQLKNIRGVRWEVFSNGWHNRWSGADDLPAGLAITLEIAPQKTVRRVFAVALSPVASTLKQETP